MGVQTRIVRLGNSRGIRLPKALIDAAQLSDVVELTAEPGRITVTAANPLFTPPVDRRAPLPIFAPSLPLEAILADLAAAREDR